MYKSNLRIMTSYLLGGGKRWRAYDIVGGSSRRELLKRQTNVRYEGSKFPEKSIIFIIFRYNFYIFFIQFVYIYIYIYIYWPEARLGGLGGGAPPGCSLIYAVNRWLALIYLVLKTERDQRERAGSSATNGRWTQNRKVMDMSVG